VSRRALAFVIFAIVVCTGCVRLGFWQLHRLAERRALNARLSARLSEQPMPVRDLLRDSTAAYRRASANGTYDFANELSLSSRTREGSPGVNIITPLRVSDSDTAVLVNRGWVYAPDAMTVDFTRWRERSAATVTGYLLALPRGGRGRVAATTNPRAVRRLDFDSLARRLPYPVAPFMLVVSETRSVATGSAARDSTPARLPPPLMDEGPHLGYAIQWFVFALIGVVGATAGVRAERHGSYHATGRTRTTIHPPETRHG
jgi:surfeit locus 1 family protein